MVVNASAALVAAGVADNFRDGAALAEKAIAQAATEKVQALVQFGTLSH